MGRHARGAARSRASVATVGLGVLVVGIIVVGSWLGSRVDSVTGSGTVAASAVVATSPPCSAGSGQTVVDVLTPVDSPSGGNLVHATLDACGYQGGQQLAVRYHAGDPTQVSLVDPAAASTATGALLPLGLALAGLLAVGAGLAVYADGRRRPLPVRHTADADATACDQTADGQPAAEGSATRPGAGDLQRHGLPVDEKNPVRDGQDVTAFDRTVGAPVVSGTAGRHAASPTEGAALTTSAWNFFPSDPRSMQFPDHNGHGPFTAAQARATSADEDPSFGEWPQPAPAPAAVSVSDLPWTAGADADRSQISSVDLIFPYSSTLAASLHDELFTHRTVSG